MLIHVQFTRESRPSLFGAAIVWWSGKPFSHARIKFQDETGKWMIYHAIECGVCVEEWIQGSEITVASFPCELYCTLDRFQGIIYGSAGKSYSTWQIIAMALGLRFGRNRSSKFVCSELVGQILKDFYKLALPGEQDSWQPWDVYIALLHHFLSHGLKFERYPLRLAVTGRK